MNIKEISIEPISSNQGHIGFCNFLYGNLKVCNIAIYTCPSHSTSIRLVFPKKDQIQICYPISKIAYEDIVLAVANKYEEVMMKLR